MSRKAKAKPYKAKRAFVSETGRDMIVGSRRGTVRFYGNGPLVKPSTAKWFYDGAKDCGKPIGEFMDDVARNLRTDFPCPQIERVDSDDPVPTTP